LKSFQTGAFVLGSTIFRTLARELDISVTTVENVTRDNGQAVETRAGDINKSGLVSLKRKPATKPAEHMGTAG
jgi:hypothetical protein